MFKEVKSQLVTNNVFELIGKDWMLISAKNNDKVNAMTASWGGFGVMWNKNVVYVVIRPQRYTKELVDSSNGFSLTFFDEEYRKVLNYMGKVSGRNEDKITTSKLTLMLDNDIPYYGEAKMAVFCTKLFAQEYRADSFIDSSIIPAWYPNNDFHTLYIAEINKILVRRQKTS